MTGSAVERVREWATGALRHGATQDELVEKLTHYGRWPQETARGLVEEAARQEVPATESSGGPDDDRSLLQSPITQGIFLGLLGLVGVAMAFLLSAKSKRETRTTVALTTWLCVFALFLLVLTAIAD